MASGCIRLEALPALRRDFPDLRKSGFHTADAFAAQGAFADLPAELSGPEVAAAMTAKLGIDFGPLPRLITVRKVSAAHEGSVHTDSASKVATLLLYLHPGWWASPEGRIRVLRRGGSLETRWPRSARRRATSSPSSAPTVPGTATPPSWASGGWCRSPGCATRPSWSASAGATASPSR
jgi:hypothetical protein